MTASPEIPTSMKNPNHDTSMHSANPFNMPAAAAARIVGFPESVSPREGYALSVHEGTDRVMEFHGGYGYYDMPDSPDPDLLHLLRSEYPAQAPIPPGIYADALPPDGERIMNGLAPSISD